MKFHLTGMVTCIALFMLSAGGAHAEATCTVDGSGPATGEPIVLGAITGQTGPDNFSSATLSAKAYFDCVNAHGGINGRPIAYEVEDDQWNPELAAQLGNKLVNDREAIAMVANSSFVECGTNAGLYEQEGIIALTGVGVPRECFYSKNHAPINAGPRTSMVGALLYAINQLDAESFVCSAPNIPGVGDWSCDGVKAVAEGLGFPVEVIIVDPGSADFTSVALQAASSNPDAIILGFPKGLTLPFLQAAEEQGLNETIHFLSAASAYDLSVPDAIGPGWDGKFYANMEFNDAESSAEDNQNWRALMDEYGEESDPRDTFSQAGYLAARLATEILVDLGPDNISREAFTNAVGEVRDYQSDIFCTPWYHDADASHHSANSSTRMSVAQDGAWVTVSGCEASTDPDLADIRAFEASAGIGG